MASLVFVEPYHKVQPPNYAAIKRASDARLADEAAEATRAAERATADAEAQRQAQAAIVVYTAPTQPTGDAKAFIYAHESGNDPTRYNLEGCVGLGQACPGSKLLAVCPTLDYGCEDNYFTDYMLERYGTWEAAMAFWVRTDCRPYCGNWW